MYCRASTAVESQVLCVAMDPDSGSVAVQLTDGSILNYSHGLYTYTLCHYAWGHIHKAPKGKT